MQALEDITARCDPSQRIQIAPIHFRVGFDAGIHCFNERIFVDIMYLRNESLLYIVEEATHFSFAKFVSNFRVDTH